MKFQLFSIASSEFLTFDRTFQQKRNEINYFSDLFWSDLKIYIYFSSKEATIQFVSIKLTIFNFDQSHNLQQKMLVKFSPQN